MKSKRLLIGLISHKIKGSGLLEVLIAMIIVLICFGMLVNFSFKVTNSTRINNSFKREYLYKRELLRIRSDDTILIDKVVPNVRINSEIERQVDSLLLFKLSLIEINSNKSNSKCYYLKSY